MRKRGAGAAAGVSFGALMGFFFGVLGWGVNQPEFITSIVVFAVLGTVVGAAVGFSSDDQVRGTGESDDG